MIFSRAYIYIRKQFSKFAKKTLMFSYEMSFRRNVRREKEQNVHKRKRSYAAPYDCEPKKRKRCQSPRPDVNAPGYSRRKALREQYHPVKKSKLHAPVSSDLLMDILQFLNRNESLKCQLISKEFYSITQLIKPYISFYVLDELAVHHNGEIYAADRERSIHLRTKQDIASLKYCLITTLQIDSLSTRIFETLKMIKNLTFTKLKVKEFRVFEPVHRLGRLKRLFEDCISVKRFSLTLSDSDLEEVIEKNSMQFSTPAEEFNLTYLGRKDEPAMRSNAMLDFLADAKIQVGNRKYAKFRGLMINELDFCERFVHMFENSENPENLFQDLEIKATRDQVIAAEWYLDGKFNALFSSNIPGVPSGFIAYQVMRNDFWTLRVMYHNKRMDRFIFSIL